VSEATNVKVVISAITEAAQQAIDEVGDELTGIADDAAISQTALDQLSDEMSESASRAALLQSALDEVSDEERQAAIYAQILKQAQESMGDEMAQSAAKATANAGALQANSAAASSASGSFGLLSTTMLLSLIPTILTLLTVLAPLAVALGAIAAGAVALAGAFGLIVGSGILAFGQERAQQNQERLNQINKQVGALERLQDSEGGLTKVQERRLQRLKSEQEELEDATTATGALQNVMGELKDEIVPLIAKFGEEFVPLIKDAINAIPTLVRRMLDAVGGTESFEEALRRFGALMMEVLPALVGLMFDLARVALPVLEDFVSFLQDNGDEALQAMQQSFEEIQPELSELLDALIEMAPVLLEFGTNAAEVVIPALTGLIKAATGFMEVVNGMPEPLQKIVMSLLLVFPLLVKFGGILTALIPSAYQLGVVFGIIEKAVAAVASVVSGSVTAAAALGAVIGLIVVKVLDMIGALAAIRDAGAAFGDMMGDMIDPFLTFITVISGGVIPLLAALGGIIIGLVRGDLQGGIDNAKQILGEFVDAFRNTYDMIVGVFQDLADFIMGMLGNSTIPDIILSGLQHIGALFVTFFTDALPSMVFGFLSDLVSGFVRIFTETLPQLAAKGMGFLLAVIETPLNRLYNLFVDVWNGIIGVIEEALETSINALINMVNNFLEGIDELADAVSDVIGRDIGNVDTIDRVDLNAADNLSRDRRETDFQQIRQQRQQQAQTVVQGGVNVDVDTGEFGRNPRRDSRQFADQLRRELRNDNGAN